MKKNEWTFMRRFAVVSLICGLAWASLGAMNTESTGNAGRSLTTDPRLDMVTTLKAIGPHRSLGDQAKVFDDLVGTWEVEYTDFSKDGTVHHRSGEFIVGWVMDGRAIQDLFTIYPSGTDQDRYIATTLRYFDSKTDTWRATFIDPANDSIMRFRGVESPDRIVFRSQPMDGKELQWSCNDIRRDSFVWREEESRDGGQNWRLQAEHHMTRRNAARHAK